MKRTAVLLVLCLLLVTLLAGCTGRDDDDDGKIGVIVTVLPQEEFAKRVGGDKVKVTVLVGEGQDPHTAQLTTGQLRDIADAELYFKVGSGVEYETANMEKILDQNHRMEVVDGSKGVELIPFDSDLDPGAVAEELFKEGPFQEVQAAESEDSAPAVEAGETCYNLSFTGEDDNRTGVVKFTPQDHGEYIIFLEHDAGELNFSLKDDEGSEVEESEHEERSRSGDDHEHAGPEWHAPYELHEETYTLNFGPTEEEECKLVILEHHEEAHDHDRSRSDEHDHGAMDPHIWNSPKNARVMVENLLEGLKRVDPENGDYYTLNANTYLAELEARDLEMEQALEPYRYHSFLVYHPSFGYLAHAYHLKQVPIEEEGKEPTPQGLQAVIEQAKEEGIKTVFVSPQFSKEQAGEIADEIGGHVAQIDPLAGNYLENMGSILEALVAGFQAEDGR